MPFLCLSHYQIALRAISQSACAEGGVLLSDSVITDAHSNTWSNTLGEWTLSFLVRRTGWWARGLYAEADENETAIRSEVPKNWMIRSRQMARDIKGRAQNLDEAACETDSESVKEGPKSVDLAGLLALLSDTDEQRRSSYGYDVIDLDFQSNLTPWIPNANLLPSCTEKHRHLLIEESPRYATHVVISPKPAREGPAGLTASQRLFRAARLARTVAWLFHPAWYQAAWSI